VIAQRAEALRLKVKVSRLSAAQPFSAAAALPATLSGKTTIFSLQHISMRNQIGNNAMRILKRDDFFLALGASGATQRQARSAFHALAHVLDHRDDEKAWKFLTQQLSDLGLTITNISDVKSGITTAIELISYTHEEDAERLHHDNVRTIPHAESSKQGC
jgi:uridine kinase